MNHFSHHKASLFLIEMLLSIFILSVSAACIAHVFSIAYSFQRDAKEMEHGKELLTLTAEILDGTDGTSESFLSILPNGYLDDQTLVYYYDKHFLNCAAPEAVYQLRLTFSTHPSEKIVFFSLQDSSERFVLEQELRSFIPHAISLEVSS